MQEVQEEEEGPLQVRQEESQAKMRDNLRRQMDSIG